MSPVVALRAIGNKPRKARKVHVKKAKHKRAHKARHKKARHHKAKKARKHKVKVRHGRHGKGKKSGGGVSWTSLM